MIKKINIVVVVIPVFSAVMALLLAEIIFTKCVSRGYYFMLSNINKRYHYLSWLKRDLADCESILELGCGVKSPILIIGLGQKTDTIDIFQPYVEAHKKAGDYNSCEQADILNYDYPVKAYDAVVLCDVLEHLPRNGVDALDLLGKIERCARKKVIIFAPNGFIPNDESDGNPYQSHKSEWIPCDYTERGYKVYGGTGYKPFFGKGSLPIQPQSLFYFLGMLSQPLIYHLPWLAFHNYAVKEIK